MDQATPEIRDLARRLVVLEASRSEHAEGKVYAALSVFAKLRSYLTRLVGVAGFQALFTRALALSKAEVGWLADVRVQADHDAMFEGFSEAAQQQSAKAVMAGSVALLTQLLGLLVTFIGETLTLRLVRDVWPEAQGDATHFNAKETPS